MGPWREIRRDALDARDRALLDAALGEPALFADRAHPARAEIRALRLWTMAGLVLAIVAPSASSAMLASTTLALVYLARRTAVRVRARRARWPQGRFLYRWGLADVTGDVLVLLPPEALAIEILRRGPWPVEVWVRPRDVSGWGAAFPLARADERAVPRAELAAIAGTGLGTTPTGYREGRPRVPGGRARRIHAPPLAIDALLAASAALLLAGSAHALPGAAPDVSSPPAPTAVAHAVRLPRSRDLRPRWPRIVLTDARLTCELCEHWPIVAPAPARATVAHARRLSRRRAAGAARTSAAHGVRAILERPSQR